MEAAALRVHWILRSNSGELVDLATTLDDGPDVRDIFWDRGDLDR